MENNKKNISGLIYVPLGLMVVQIAAIIFVRDYSPMPDFWSKAYVILNYICFGLGLLLAKNTLNIRINNNCDFLVKKLDFVRILFACLFVLISIKAISVIGVFIVVYGFEGIRDFYYTDGDFAIKAFGGVFWYFMYNQFLYPVSIYMIVEGLVIGGGTYKKIAVILLLVGVSLGAMVGGRFGIYYIAILLLIVDFVKNNMIYTKKYGLVGIMVLLLLTYLIKVNRHLVNEQMGFYEYLISVVDYHIAPIFLCAHKVSTNFNGFDYNVFPGEVTFNAPFVFFGYITGLSPSDMGYFRLGEYMRYPTMISEVSGRGVNAFGTVFSGLIVDFDRFAWLASYMMGYLLVFSVRLVKLQYVIVYLIYIVLGVYFSLFMSFVGSFGFQIIVISHILYGITVPSEKNLTV